MLCLARLLLNRPRALLEHARPVAGMPAALLGLLMVRQGGHFIVLYGDSTAPQVVECGPNPALQNHLTALERLMQGSNVATMDRRNTTVSISPGGTYVAWPREQSVHFDGGVYVKGRTYVVPPRRPSPHGPTLEIAAFDGTHHRSRSIDSLSTHSVEFLTDDEYVDAPDDFDPHQLAVESVAHPANRRNIRLPQGIGGNIIGVVGSNVLVLIDRSPKWYRLSKVTITPAGLQATSVSIPQLTRTDWSSSLCISPDGRRVGGITQEIRSSLPDFEMTLLRWLHRVPPKVDDQIWVYDLERKTMISLGHVQANGADPIRLLQWSSDSSSLFFVHDKEIYNIGVGR